MLTVKCYSPSELGQDFSHHTTTVYTEQTARGCGGWERDNQLRSEKKIPVSSGSLLSLNNDDEPPPPSRRGGGGRDSMGQGAWVETQGFGGRGGLQLGPRLWETRGSRGGQEGGRRQPKQRSWRYFAKHTKINHCPIVALTFVGSDTLHDRLEEEDERRVREGWVNKSCCHSLWSCVHACLYVDVLSACFCFPAL